MKARRKFKPVYKALFGLGISLSALFIMIKSVAAQAPSLEFSATSKIVRTDETFSVDIIVDTVKQSAHGTGVKITFDPEVLEVISIETGSIFGDYPVASYDNSVGKIIISGISSSIRNEFNGRGVFATLTFRAIKKGGTTLQFDYQPGSTTDSNIAVTYGTGDILSNVNSLLVTVTAGVGGETSVPTTFLPQTEIASEVAAEDSLLTRLFRFLGLGDEPVAVRTGRPQSEFLDASAPIPFQQPITDASQAQPESVVGSQGSDYSRIILFALIILVVIIIFFLVRRLLKSRKALTAPKQENKTNTPQV
jgi:hypothetical protein